MARIELIAYYTKNLNKVIASHGVASDYTTHAFFQLQGAIIGVKNIHDFARSESDRLHQIALNQLPSMSE